MGRENCNDKEGRERDRVRENEADMEVDEQGGWERDRQSERYGERLAESERYGETNRERDMERDRQRVRDMERDRH